MIRYLEGLRDSRTRHGRKKGREREKEREQNVYIYICVCVTSGKKMNKKHGTH